MESEEEEEAGSENDPNQEDEEEIEVSDDEDEGSESQDSKAESTDTVPAEDGDLDRFFRAHTNPFATDDELPEKSRKNPLVMRTPVMAMEEQSKKRKTWKPFRKRAHRTPIQWVIKSMPCKKRFGKPRRNWRQRILVELQ